jgi:hypothetical protein
MRSSGAMGEAARRIPSATPGEPAMTLPRSEKRVLPEKSVSLPPSPSIRRAPAAMPQIFTIVVFTPHGKPMEGELPRSARATCHNHRGRAGLRLGDCDGNRRH